MGSNVERSKHVIFCDTCGAQLDIAKRSVPALEWADNYAWKALRAKASNKGWAVNASRGGKHFCRRCTRK